MSCHSPAPDTSNVEAVARAQQQVEFSASVSERSDSRRNFFESGSDREIVQEAEESELEELRSRGNGRTRIRKSHQSLAVANRGQDKEALRPLESILLRNDFRVLDAPAKDTPDQTSRHLTARNADRRSTLSNASINPNGLGRIPKSIKVRPPTPPSPVYWRGSSGRQGPLNGDMRRIDSDYLLSKEFVHDINEMLDKIRGWHADLVKPYELSFQQDADNSGRQVKIVEFGQRVWVVKITNPNKLTWHSALNDDFMFADLPKDCQVNGCDLGCPRAMTRTERHYFIEKEKRLHPNPLECTKVSGISPDLPRIFGKQSFPVPPTRWELLGYRGLKYPTGLVKMPPKPTEKQGQHFKACSPPKRAQQHDNLEGDSTSSAATCTTVIDKVSSSETKDSLNPGVQR